MNFEVTKKGLSGAMLSAWCSFFNAPPRIPVELRLRSLKNDPWGFHKWGYLNGWFIMENPIHIFQWTPIKIPFTYIHIKFSDIICFFFNEPPMNRWMIPSGNLT